MKVFNDPGQDVICVGVMNVQHNEVMLSFEVGDGSGAGTSPCEERAGLLTIHFILKKTFKIGTRTYRDGFSFEVWDDRCLLEYTDYRLKQLLNGEDFILLEKEEQENLENIRKHSGHYYEWVRRCYEVMKHHKSSIPFARI